MGVSERRKKEKTEMRNLILKTAMRLFLDEGFAKVTIRRVAAEIEYSPATIYLYFKDKNDLLYALHAEGFERFYNRQLKILSEKDPWKRLRMHAHSYVSFAVSNPEFYELMFIMRGPAREIKEKRNWEIGLRSFEFLKLNILDCMEAGLLSNEDLDTAAFAFWSITHGIASLIIRERCIMFPKDKIKDVVREAMDFIMNSMARKGR